MDFAAEPLRVHLADLNRRERAQREACEALLHRGVALRSERRELQGELRRSEAELHGAQGAPTRSLARQGYGTEVLRSELEAERADLDAARAALREVQAPWVWEDAPAHGLGDADRRCRLLEAEGSECQDAREAAAQLVEHLAARLGPMEVEVERLRSEAAFEAAGRRAADPGGVGGLQKLRGEVKILSKKAAVLAGEASAQAQEVWAASESELPRLRRADQDRRRLQAELSQARYERDALERDYERILRGLREQEQEQQQSKHALRASLIEIRSEGEAMVAELRENDLQLAKMRHAHADSESFSEHLSRQVAALEREHGAVIKSLRAASADVPQLYDHGDVVARRDELRRGQEAMLRDEEVAEALKAECLKMEALKWDKERRASELRSELAFLAARREDEQAQLQDDEHEESAARLQTRGS